MLQTCIFQPNFPFFIELCFVLGIIVYDVVSLADQTFSVLMNSVPNKTIEDACEDLPDFISSRKNWCKKEASYVLGKKGKHFEKWKKDFLYIAFDPVAIIWAHSGG